MFYQKNVPHCSLAGRRSRPTATISEEEEFPGSLTLLLEASTGAELWENPEASFFQS
jgi:hypothetical protein